MATYVFQFGNGNPSSFAGLAPTFIVFTAVGIGSTTPPAITQIPTSTGLYYTTYTPLSTVAFVLDGTATVTNNGFRYISGAMSPADNGPSLLGTLSDSFGSTLADPTTVFGYLRRLQEYNEGNNVFNKVSGALQYWSRGVTYASGTSVYSGSSAMLIQKSVVDSGSVITKS